MATSTPLLGTSTCDDMDYMLDDSEADADEEEGSKGTRAVTSVSRLVPPREQQNAGRAPAMFKGKLKSGSVPPECYVLAHKAKECMAQCPADSAAQAKVGLFLL